MFCRGMSSVRTRSMAETSQAEENKQKCTICKWNKELYTEAELLEHKKRDHPTCLSCDAPLSKYHRGIKCTNNHHLCRIGCSTTFINSQLSDMLIPFKCSICSVPIAAALARSNMTEAQQNQYVRALSSQHSLSADDTVLQCHNKKCQELITPGFTFSSEEIVVNCTHCSLATCYICFAGVDPTQSGKVAQHQVRCGEILKLKREFEQAIVKGTSFQCPRCQRGGRKDDGCNYIHCAGCPAVWCYLCGLEETSAHHHCRPPQVHITLPSDFKGTYMDRLHHSRTVGLLHGLYRKHGQDKLRTLWDRFESVRAHGYSWEEIAQLPGL